MSTQPYVVPHFPQNPTSNGRVFAMFTESGYPYIKFSDDGGVTWHLFINEGFRRNASQYAVEFNGAMYAVNVYDAFDTSPYAYNFYDYCVSHIVFGSSSYRLGSYDFVYAISASGDFLVFDHYYNHLRKNSISDPNSFSLLRSYVPFYQSFIALDESSTRIALFRIESNNAFLFDPVTRSFTSITVPSYMYYVYDCIPNRILNDVLFVLVSWPNSRYFYSINGTTWHELSVPPAYSNYRMVTICYSSSAYIVIGRGPSYNYKMFVYDNSFNFLYARDIPDFTYISTHSNMRAAIAYDGVSTFVYIAYSGVYKITNTSSQLIYDTGSETFIHVWYIQGAWYLLSIDVNQRKLRRSINGDEWTVVHTWDLPIARVGYNIGVSVMTRFHLDYPNYASGWLTYAGGVFEFIGNYGDRHTSTDGITWTIVQSGFTPVYNHRSFSNFAKVNGVYVSLCFNGLATSPNNSIYTSVVLFPLVGKIHKIENGVYFCAAGSSYYINSTSDAFLDAWTIYPLPSNYTVAYRNTGAFNIAIKDGRAAFVAYNVSSGELALVVVSLDSPSTPQLIPLSVPPTPYIEDVTTGVLLNNDEAAAVVLRRNRSLLRYELYAMCGSATFNDWRSTRLLYTHNWPSNSGLLAQSSPMKLLFVENVSSIFIDACPPCSTRFTNNFGQLQRAA